MDTKPHPAVQARVLGTRTYGPLLPGLYIHIFSVNALVIKIASVNLKYKFYKILTLQIRKYMYNIKNQSSSTSLSLVLLSSMPTSTLDWLLPNESCQALELEADTGVEVIAGSSGCRYCA